MEEGKEVFYTEDGNVYSGKIIDVEDRGNTFLFSIDSYGACEGHYRISSVQIGRSVFYTREEAERSLNR